MFTNFDDIFGEDPKAELNLPDRYIDFISSHLPEGLKYIADENGNCTINSQGKNIKIGGIKFLPNEEQKSILGDVYSVNDILSYSYNSQQKIEIVLVEDGYIILNGKKVSIDRLEYNPINPITIMKGKFYLIPRKLEEHFSLELSDGNYRRKLSISRVPNNSINIIKFQSKKNEPLIINYTFNIEIRKMKMNLSFNLNFVKKIKDIVEIVRIYNAFIDGKGYINDHLIKVNRDYKAGNKYDEKNILFWEKLLMIEKVIDVEFIPSKENIKYEEMLEVEELYQSLVKKRPFKDKNKINSLSGKWDFKKKEDIKACIGKPLFFRFEATYSTSILNCNIKLPALLMIFNSKLSKIEKQGNDTKMVLEDENDSLKGYTSIMCFKNKDELRIYEKKENDGIQLFKDAKSASEYLNEH